MSEPQKLIYPSRVRIVYPKLSQIWQPQFPPGVDGTNIDKSCTCYIHAPELWTSRFGTNPPFTGTEPPIPVDDIPKSVTLRRSCDYRVPIALFEAHIQRLMDDGMTDKQRLAFNKFHVPYANFNLWRHGEAPLPSLSSMMKPLITIFFDGCLNNIEFQWVDKDEDNGNIYGNHAGGRGSHTSLLSICAEQHRDETTETELLATMLHELLHEYTLRFFCNGEDCHMERRSTLKDLDKLSSLCQYQYARCVDLFRDVMYEGTTFETEGAYRGHGPVFLRLITILYEAVPKVFGQEFTLHMTDHPGERACKCQGENRCLAHCCDTYRDMQFYGRNQIMAQEGHTREETEE